ncbi:MAG: HEAT repeat domain-containing protein [Verrucomicrobia bacterium]|nr:HEAT repeat domain-containing protein [Verrucomicrobiota bacterium]
MKLKLFCTSLMLLMAACSGGLSSQAADPASIKLDLRPNDHVTLIGNALADRMQHHGWLETLIHAKFPNHNLVFRNLAVSGDEVTTRHRSDNFGSPDEWLTRTKTDVVFAFFGFNESFKGEKGLTAFKQDLDKFIKDTRKQKYNGKTNPRIVLFSPTANENLPDSTYYVPEENNANIKVYAAAMAEVAKENEVPFVDLFTLSTRLYADAANRGQSLTFNGLHLTEGGDQVIAPEIFRALFNESAPSGDLAALRSDVLNKNAEWHGRYRTVDGYNVYGGRSQLRFPVAGKDTPSLTNYDIMQDEMLQRDVKTANRDHKIWATAQHKDFKVDDSNLPTVRTIQSNKPDVAPFLDPEEAISHMTVAEGCKVTLFASEVTFPQLVSPVQMGFDTRGRLWVAAWPSYPERTPTSTSGDSLLILEDTDNDGKADKVTPFLEDLNCPTGFQFYKDGVLIMQAPDLWFARDTDGDGRADWKERVLMGMDSADSHHTANAMVLDPGGATYLSDGVFHRTQVETASGPVRNNDGCIYRYEPLTGKFERYVAYGFANPHGRAFDYWGTDIITDATGNANYFAPAFSGWIEYPGKHKRLQEFWKRPSRPCAGTAILSSRHFPDEFQGNFLNCNVIGFQGIFRVKVTEDGSGLKGETIEDLVKSDDPNFRPSSVSVAPDGSIYFLDWAKELIGHMQHHIRDPNRDKTHGRVYRITYPSRPLLKPARVHGESTESLLALLTEPENDVRTRAKIELGTHDSAKVIAAVQKWAATLDSKAPNYEHSMMEALWVHQWHDVVNEGLLKRMLRSPNPNARTAATRVLCYWRDRVEAPLALLKAQVNDESPRVRLEAVRACSFFKNQEAASVALEALNHEMDYYLQYTLDETMGTLEKLLKQPSA